MEQRSIDEERKRKRIKRKSEKGLVVFQWLWWVQLSSGSNGITCVSDKILRLLGHFSHLNDINQARERERERWCDACGLFHGVRIGSPLSSWIVIAISIITTVIPTFTSISSVGFFVKISRILRAKLKKQKKKRSWWWKRLHHCNPENPEVEYLVNLKWTPLAIWTNFNSVKVEPAGLITC